MESLHAMTLNTKLPSAAHLELALEVRAVRVMTANAGYYLAGPGVLDPLSHRMGELALAFMTVRADSVSVPLQHARLIRAMGFMTGTAAADLVHVVVNTYLVLLERIGMTLPADLFLRSSDQAGLISGMWRVTCCTAVFRAAGKVIMGFHDLIPHLVVTVEAGLGVNLDRPAGVAGGTIILIGRMQHVAHQAFTAAAVRIMARKTALDIGGKFLMDPIRLILRVAGKAYLAGLVLFQELRVVGVMGPMAYRTLAPGKRPVDNLILLLQAFVTGKTPLRQPALDQSPVIRGMGIVTGKTFTLLDRLVGYPLFKGLLLFFMAGVTQLGARFLQEPGKPGHVRIMAG